MEVEDEAGLAEDMAVQLTARGAAGEFRVEKATAGVNSTKHKTKTLKTKNTKNTDHCTCRVYIVWIWILILIYTHNRGTPTNLIQMREKRLLRTRYTGIKHKLFK